MTKPTEPEGLTLRDLIAEVAADLSTGNPVWTAGELAEALIARGIGIAPAQTVADAGGEVEVMDRALFSQIFGILPSASPIDQKALKSIVAFRLQSVAAATVAKDGEIRTLTEALLNMMGIFDNAVYRRRLANDTLYPEAIRIARAALSEAREAGDSLSAEDRV